MPIDAILRPILQTVLDAVVVMDRSGAIRQWNSHAEATFGWSADEAIGQNLEIIIPPALRQAHRRGLKRFNSTGVGRVLNQRLELSGMRRDGSEFPLELSITLVVHQERELFVGFLRDISDRRRAEDQLAFQLRESRLMFELSELASREGSFEEALVAALDAICELAGWPVGHAWLVDPDDSTLRSAAWSSEARRIAPKFVKGTGAITFTRGIGLPGRVLENGRAHWISQVKDDVNFLRGGLGFQSGCAFAVHSGGRCIAILEFFSQDVREPEEALLLSAQAIGAQVGRVFERKRGEELRELLLGELDHRARNILAVVRGMAHLSFKSAGNIAEAQAAFDQRLDAIAKANDILHAHSGSEALLGDIVGQALSGCGAPHDRVSVEGISLCIDSSTSIIIALALHELCTNAFKHGALSVASGRIAVRWSVDKDDSRFTLEWTETGGPKVETPQSTGFGTRILTRAVESATGGVSDTRFERTGLRYRLRGARHCGTVDQARVA